MTKNIIKKNPNGQSKDSVFSNQQPWNKRNFLKESIVKPNGSENKNPINVLHGSGLSDYWTKNSL